MAAQACPRVGALRQVISCPANKSGSKHSSSTSYFALTESQRSASWCAKIQAHTSRSADAAKESTSSPKEDRMSSHWLASSSKKESDPFPHNQARNRATRATFQNEQKTASAYWKAFQASYEPMPALKADRIEETHVKSRHLREYLSHCSRRRETPGAGLLLSACIAAAEEGLGHEVVAILRMKHLQSQPEQLKLTSAHTELLKVNTHPAADSSWALPKKVLLNNFFCYSHHVVVHPCGHT